MNAKSAASQNQERIFDGLGVAPGVGIGTVHLRESGHVAVPEYTLPKAKIEAEVVRYQAAVLRSRRQIGRLRTKTRSMEGAAGDELEFLLDAYYQMLKDSRLVRGAEARIRDDAINAEAAVQAEMAAIAIGFQTMDDAYIAARVDDIRGIAARLIRNLSDAPTKPLSTLPKNSIVVAETLTPADTAQLDPTRVTGVATLLGGAEGHTAIMARALGLPAVLGVPGLMDGVKNGDTIIVDGGRGRIVVNPTAKTLAAFEAKRTEHHRQSKRLSRLRDLPSVSRDDVDIMLHANVELPIEKDQVLAAGAAGIGLLRTEFQFMSRPDVPDEDEQFESLKDLVIAMDGRPITVRTLDIGGEKVAESLTGDFGESASSALGLRGVRLSLARESILEAQLAAILRVSVLGPVRILLPMVSTTTEVRRVRDVMKRVVTRLRRRKQALPAVLPPLGIMIEVPGAALSADSLAREVDFFAIGSNDLTQYTLAIDRADEQVAHLYDPMHPSVLRLIQFSLHAAQREGIRCSVCGEIAGDPRYTALLLGLGFRELSMTASSIPRVKQRLRELDISAADKRAAIIMDQVDAGRIAMLLDDFNALS